MDEGHSPAENPILHVLVVGFHHKKGCQVEYAYPTLGEGEESGARWKYLPTLALPDGSHNYEKDTVFFALPALADGQQAIFGVSCFRQIPVERLKNKTEDITRSTVQKAVCVLSRVPLYGYIQVKVELITHAYFDEGDFTKVSILEHAYHNLNDCIQQIEDLNSAPQLYVGLSARELVGRLRHKALLLYKLLLLQRKVLFFQTPVEPLCSLVLTLLSLHPRLLASGLSASAFFRVSRSMSLGETDKNEYVENGHRNSEDSCEEKEERMNISRDDSSAAMTREDSSIVLRRDDSSVALSRDESSAALRRDDSSTALARDDSSADLANGDINACSLLAELAQLDPEKCGFPLPLFTQGYLCLPYLSLPYMDMLLDKNVKGHLVGATNVLFKQKKNLADILIELESGRIETSDPELKKVLHLTTEDLRFADYLVRAVTGGREMDSNAGSEEWLREQFFAYTVALLRTSLLPENSKETEAFNKWYVAELQKTCAVKEWTNSYGGGHINLVSPGHPFAGHLSVADVKLRLSHTMQATEGGRKLNQAMASTGRAVASTGRAVGGALSQARGALSTWWNSLAVPPQPRSEVENGVDARTLNDSPEVPILEV